MIPTSGLHSERADLLIVMLSPNYSVLLFLCQQVNFSPDLLPAEQVPWEGIPSSVSKSNCFCANQRLSMPGRGQCHLFPKALRQFLFIKAGCPPLKEDNQEFYFSARVSWASTSRSRKAQPWLLELYSRELRRQVDRWNSDAFTKMVEQDRVLIS